MSVLAISCLPRTDNMSGIPIGAALDGSLRQVQVNSDGPCQALSRHRLKEVRKGPRSEVPANIASTSATSRGRANRNPCAVSTLSAARWRR